MPPTLLCRWSDETSMCRHTIDLHGARAGQDPKHCMVPGCQCPLWNPPAPPPPRVPRLADPHHDRDLYLAWIQALDVATHSGDPEAGYQLMMTEISRWQRRIHGLPNTPWPASQTVEQT